MARLGGVGRGLLGGGAVALALLLAGLLGGLLGGRRVFAAVFLAWVLVVFALAVVVFADDGGALGRLLAADPADQGLAALDQVAVGVGRGRDVARSPGSGPSRPRPGAPRRGPRSPRGGPWRPWSARRRGRSPRLEACSRRALGCEPVERGVCTSFWTPANFFCTSATYSRTASTARSVAPTPAYRAARAALGLDVELGLGHVHLLLLVGGRVVPGLRGWFRSRRPRRRSPAAALSARNDE